MSLLSETVVHVLSANETVTGQVQTESVLPGQVNVSEAVFTVAAPLAIGQYTITLDRPIPSNAFVFMSLMDVEVAVLGGAGATIGMGLNSTNNMTGGIQQALGAWGIGLTKYSPVVALAAQANAVTVNIAVNNVTAGLVNIKLLWV